MLAKHCPSQNVSKLCGIYPFPGGKNMVLVVASQDLEHHGFAYDDAISLLRWALKNNFDSSDKQKKIDVDSLSMITIWSICLHTLPISL